MTTTATRYRFPLLINDNFSAVTNTSLLLNLQDAFVVSHWGFFVAAPSSTTDTTYQLVTYPNSTIFSTANAASSLYTAYNGFFTLTVNNRVIVPQLDAYRFYDVPQTQDGTNTIDQQKGSDSALYPVEPGIVLVGSKQNVLELILPSALAAVQGSANPRFVVYFAGHLAQNVTPVN